MKDFLLQTFVPESFTIMPAFLKGKAIERLESLPFDSRFFGILVLLKKEIKISEFESESEFDAPISQKENKEIEIETYGFSSENINL